VVQAAETLPRQNHQLQVRRLGHVGVSRGQSESPLRVRRVRERTRPGEEAELPTGHHQGGQLVEVALLALLLLLLPVRRTGRPLRPLRQPEADDRRRLQQQVSAPAPLQTACKLVTFQSRHRTAFRQAQSHHPPADPRGQTSATRQHRPDHRPLGPSRRLQDHRQEHDQRTGLPHAHVGEARRGPGRLGRRRRLRSHRRQIQDDRFASQFRDLHHAVRLRNGTADRPRHQEPVQGQPQHGLVAAETEVSPGRF
jgi:hypothetical protein